MVLVRVVFWETATASPVSMEASPPVSWELPPVLALATVSVLTLAWLVTEMEGEPDGVAAGVYSSSGERMMLPSQVYKILIVST